MDSCSISNILQALLIIALLWSTYVTSALRLLVRWGLFLSQTCFKGLRMEGTGRVESILRKIVFAKLGLTQKN